MARRIMVAEDDYDLRMIVSDFLTASGYDVVLAPSGEEAIRLATALPPDLLILDLSMPKVDGWEVLRTLRNHTETKSLPIVAFTAHAMAADRQKALSAGCDGFVAKPFSPPELLHEVQRLLAAKTVS